MGENASYFPIIGILAKLNNDAKKKGDFFYYSKQPIKANPDLKLGVTNIGSQVLLSVADPGYKWRLIFKFGYEPDEHVPIILQPLNRINE